MKKFYLKTHGTTTTNDSYSIHFSTIPLETGKTGVGQYAVVLAEDEKDLQERLSFRGKGFGDTLNFVLNPIGK